MTAAELITLLERLPGDFRVVAIYDDGAVEGEVVAMEADEGELRLLVE